MSSTPTVSVIIPCYNLGAYLDQSVQSVLNQTYKDFEILIIDDGSSETAKLHTSATNQPPKVRLFWKEKCGLAEARNLGIKEANGRYISCLDSGNLLEPNFLQSSIESLESNPSVAFASSWSKSIGKTEFLWKPTCDFPQVLAEYAGFTALLVRKELLVMVGGFDLQIPLAGCEDWDLAISLVKRGFQGIIIPEVLSRRRIRLGSSSASCTNPTDHTRLMSYLVEKHAKNYGQHRGGVIDAIEKYILELEGQADHLLVNEDADQEQRIVFLENILRSILESGNWRFTRPLRQGFSLLKGFQRRLNGGDAGVPRISVVLTCHDQGRELPRALDSIRSQVVAENEIIIVDANSSDPLTRQLLDWYQEAGLKVIRMKEKGLTAAREAGLRQARAPILFAISVGQTLESNSLPRAIQALETDPGLSFVLGGLRDHATGFTWIPESADLPGLLSCPRVAFPVLRRESLMKAGGYDVNLHNQEQADWELAIRLMVNGLKGFVFPEPLVNRHNYQGRREELDLSLSSIRGVIEKHSEIFESHWKETILGRENERRRLQAHLDPASLFATPLPTAISNEWSHLIPLNSSTFESSPLITHSIVAKKSSRETTLVDLWKKSIPIEDVVISVAIPTKNAGEDIRPLLSMLKNQLGFRRIEVILVDSGSTDQTLKIAREFGVEVIEILPEKFSHSYARNLAAENATGDFILFTVQDALPPSLTWLHELYRAIKSHGTVAASCAELPREDADLFYRALSWNHYRFLDVQNQDRILERPIQENYESIRRNANLSDIACLIDRNIFLKYKFRGDYAEDLDLGIRLINDGHKLALLGSTRVIHSHNRQPYYHLKRGYVDNLCLAKLFPDHQLQAAEPSRLVDDIMFVYRAVFSLSERMGASTQPLPINTLITIVMDEFGIAASRHWPVQITVEGDGNIDVQFQSFIADLYKRYYNVDVIGIRYNGILLEAMQGFTGIILQYMEVVYDVLDEPLIDDFRKCLFKAFAFVCGIHLASSLRNASSTSKNLLHEICSNLSHAV